MLVVGCCQHIAHLYVLFMFYWHVIAITQFGMRLPVHAKDQNLLQDMRSCNGAIIAGPDLVSELIPKLRFHYISLHWVSDYLPVSLNQERF